MNSGWKLVEAGSDLVYRMQGLPKECNKETLKIGIDKAFSLREEGSGVHIHSLAASASRESEKTATVTAPALSTRLIGPQNEWIFEVPFQSLTLCLEDFSTGRVSIDTQFNGFTTLFAPPANEHVVEYGILDFVWLLLIKS